MGFVIWVLTGLIIAYMAYCGPKTEDFLRTAYIEYRCKEIADGKDPFTESTFRKFFVTSLAVIAAIGWPYLIIRSIYKKIRGK